MTIEERVAVLENENSNLKSELHETQKEVKSINEKLSDVRFKVKIIWGSIAAILSALGIAFVNFLMD